MMQKTAVLFVLITALVFAAIFTGCSSNETGGSGQSGISGSADGAGQNDSPGKTGVSSQTGSSETADNSGKVDSSSQTNAQDSSKIPDTNESAVSDWGVADATDNTHNVETENSNAGTDVSRIIVDRDDLLFAVKEVKADAALGYTWKVYNENRTDKNLMFSFEKVSVNGVMCDPFWAEVVTAGKKGNCEIIWMRDALEERQIEEVTQVDFTLNVYNDDDYAEAPLMHDPFTVYPLGEDVAEGTDKQSAPPARKPAETDIVLIDNDDCAIIVTGFDPENSWGYAVRLYLRNKTEEDLIFSTENTSVNGIMCEPFWAEIVTAGHSAFSTILWDNAALQENEIAEVNEISLPMRVYSDKDIANPYVEETFELNP